MTAFLQNKTYIPVISATILITIAAILSYDWMSEIQYVLLIAGSIFIGIPHGATDNHIFLKSNLFRTKYRTWLFYSSYLLIAGFYAVLWIFFPAISLIIFLLISVYHFGQSNLFYLPVHKNTIFRLVTSISWGSYVLGLPLLFQADEALPVIEKILGTAIFTPFQIQEIAWPLAILLFVINAGTLTYFKIANFYKASHFMKEIFSLIILGILAYFAPLFIAFFTYWIFWHSLNSIFEINNFLFGKNHARRLRLFYKKSWPLSLISVTGIVLILLLSNHMQSVEGLLSVYFILIAVLTLPHIIMMDWLYIHKLKSQKI